jgi:hypothetical protein
MCGATSSALLGARPRERNAAMHQITVRLVSLAALASSALLAAGLKGW